MRLALLTLALTAATTIAVAVEWAPAPDVYRLSPDGSVEARDGGQSTGDHYLLTASDYRDFILEFEAERLAEVGERPRSIVVWALDPANPANRKAFFMDLASLRLGERVAVRVVVFGGRALLQMNGRDISASPVVYGAPSPAGRVGFLHYYNYAYRYTNIRLTPLEAASLPAPTGLQGKLSPGGVLNLQWHMPAPYDGVVSYRVFRAVGGPAGVAPSDLLGETTTSSFRDPSLPSTVVARYAVAAIGADGATGPLSGSFALRTPRLRPSAAPVRVQGTRRLDGSVRVRWEFAPDTRQAGVSIFRGQSEAELQAANAPVVAAKLPQGVTEFLAPPGPGDYVAVAALDPDGRPAPRRVAVVTLAAPPVPDRPGVPARHPYLLYDTAQIERARSLMATQEWAREVADSQRRTAEALIAKPAAVPTAPNDDMDALPRRLLDVGLAYQLFGDEGYARWVRDALVEYARVYPTLPAVNGRVRMSKTVSGLYEAVWFVPLVCAYDLVYESPAFSAEDHELIQRDLIRLGAELFWVKDYADPADNRPADLHYKCYNFQAWFDAAVGLAGFLLRDADMVEHAIDGPYGLKHLLAHDVHDDGVFWERSLGYHSFVLTALFPLLQAGTHCGLDLWQVAVPDDYNSDREPLANYTVGDGDNGPKSLRLMLDAPFYFTFPDLSWPVVADSGAGPLSIQNWYRVGWERLGDPKYAWLLNRPQAAPARPVWTGPDDASADIRMAYDEANLYLAAQVRDQVVRNSHKEPGNAWAGDLVWVGLKWSAGRGGGYDFIYGLTPGDGEQSEPVPALFTRFGAPLNGRSAAQLSVTRTEVGYDLEAAIPLAEFVPQAGEPGEGLRPALGQELTLDFVLYDSDERTGATTKEKMVGWACTTDRYDSAQGGRGAFGVTAPEGPRAISIPPVTGLTVDGSLADWAALSAAAAVIGEGSAVMYDNPPGGPGLADLLYERPPPDAGAFDLRGQGFANNGVLEEGCSLFPSTGFALLRERLNEEGLAPLDATAVNVTYGPYGGGHGHPDKLSLVVYAHQMHLIPDFGSCGYDSAEKSQWTAQTISHNTVTVDQTSQWPADGVETTWPCDSAARQARGFLECFHADPLLKAVQAYDDSTYPGVHQRRTVALLGSTVFDFLALTSAQKHTYDYALHVALPFAEANLPLAALADPLGSKLGYQHIHHARGSEPVDGAVQTEWREGGKRLRLSAAPAAGTQLIVADSITTSLDRLMPMQIIRREASSTVFAMVMQPFAGEGEPEVWEWVQGTNCLAATGAGGTVAWSPDSKKPSRTAGMDFSGVMAAAAAEGLSLVQGKLLQWGDFRLQASAPVSLHVAFAEGRPREVRLGYQSEAVLTITWRGATQRIHAKPRQRYEIAAR
ncbi:MAG: hypothetical protein HPY69_12985 [Armatimonadetes bacterium]|nr:hypothetical protein [Armatimonadota bacterium]